MKLAELASKPQLVPVTIDDKAVVAKYGEPLEFFIYDRQDMDTFMKLARLEGEEDVSVLSEIVSAMILDENGEKIIQGDNTLPTEIMLKVIETTVRYLGNSVTQTSEK